MGVLPGHNKFVQQALKYGFSLFGLPATSQTIVYQTNDDGTYQKGYPRQGARFVDNGDGTVTDNATGLMWPKDLEVLGVATSWVDSINKAEVFAGAGYTDWRAPNLKELISIFNFGRSLAGENPGWYEIFTTVLSLHFWTSTTYIAGTTYAWAILANTGDVVRALKTINSYRCVCVRLGYPPAA